jgi:hypothetical protein
MSSKWFQARSGAGRLPCGRPALRVLAMLDDIKQEEAAPEQISTAETFGKARNRQHRVHHIRVALAHHLNAYRTQYCVEIRCCPSATSLDVRRLIATGGKADEAPTGQKRRS